MIRISKQALTSKIEAYGLFVYIKIELYGFTAIALWPHGIEIGRSQMLLAEWKVTSLLTNKNCKQNIHVNLIESWKRNLTKKKPEN